MYTIVPMWIYWRVLFLVVGILLVNLHLAIHKGGFVAPISVALEGFREEDAASARLFASFLIGFEEIPAERAGVWECPPRCTVDVLLHFAEPPQSPDGIVRVKIGDESHTIPFRDLVFLEETYWLPAHIRLGPVPSFAPCRNWPGTDVFVASWLLRCVPALIAIALLGLITMIGMREPFRAAFQNILAASQSSAIPTAERFWNLAGWLFLIGGFIGLEWMQPYYFTRDDALIGELPGILLGFRSLWEGTFPDWNPYVFLGAPLAIIGFWAITYPPQALSYAIARHILGNEFATMEVFAALHLLAGFIAMRYLSRRIGMSALPANLAALSFVYAGCILIMGRSWHAFIANAVWFPLLGIGIQRFREGPVGWKWIIGIGVTLGLSYHAGFPQIAAILGMFFALGLAVVVLAERLPLRRVLPVIPALLLAAGISAPLLLHHLQWTGGLQRNAPVESGVYDGLHAALLPYPLVETEFPTHWGSDVEKIGHFYFFGGIFAVLFALQAFYYWVFLPERSAWGCWWVPCGIFALLMVLGEPALLWKGVSALPMSKFFLRYSFRFYPWLAFCAILSGGLILDRILVLLQAPSPPAPLPQGARGGRLWRWPIAVGMFGILAYHLAMCQSSFYAYGFEPYPPLPEEFESVFHPYEDRQQIGEKNSRRIASWAQHRSPSPDFYLSLPLNLPHYYQVPSIFGYDPVVEGQPAMAGVVTRMHKDPIAACKAYGVGWHLFSYSDPPIHSANKKIWRMEREIFHAPVYRKLLKADLPTRAEVRGTRLKELPAVDALAFVTSKPHEPLPMRLHCQGADIDVSKLATETPITLNFLWYPQMRTFLDGEEIGIDKDDWQRITTRLPKPGTTLALRFQPPWQKTCAVGAGLCVAALVLAWGALRLITPLAASRSP